MKNQLQRAKIAVTIGPAATGDKIRVIGGNAARRPRGVTFIKFHKL